MAKRLTVEKTEELPDALLIGISTLLRDYEIARIINMATGADLVRQEAVPVFREKTQTVAPYSFYTYYDELCRRTLDLVHNRGQSGPALSLTPPMDYLLLVHGRAMSGEVEGWLSALRQDREIIMVQVIETLPPETVGLLADIELHHTEIRKCEDPPFRSEEPRKKNR